MTPIVCPHCSRSLAAAPEFDWLWRFVELYDRAQAQASRGGPHEARLSGILAALELAEGLARDLVTFQAQGLAGAVQVALAYAVNMRSSPASSSSPELQDLQEELRFAIETIAQRERLARKAFELGTRHGRLAHEGGER